jgi:hypothetical protein
MVGVVLGKLGFVAIPLEPAVALLVVEEELEASLRPAVSPEVLVELPDAARELGLVTGLAPPQVT